MNSSAFKTVLPLLIVAFAVNGCSVVDSFRKKGKEPLKGERISVMELQESLTPEADAEAAASLELPQAWKNQFWPQTGGYPNHSMQHLALGPAPLKVKWSKSIGRGDTDELPLTAQPVVVDGTVYAMDVFSVITAFDIENGERRWRLDARNKKEDDHVISGGLAYADGVLYATNGSDEILAISPKDASILWRADLPAAARAAPTVMNGRVFVMTLDNRLLAFSTDKGALLWDHVGLSEATGVVGAASPAANREIVVPAFSSGEIVALRVENGSLAWSDNLAGVRNMGGLAGLADVRALPVLDKGLVIAISFSGRMVAIDERTGQRIWQREISGSQVPWVAGDYIFVLSEMNELVALSRDTGAVLWVTDLPRYLDPEDKKGPVRWSGPVLAGGRLILAGDNRMFMELDAKTGTPGKSYRLDHPIAMPPVVADGALYLLSGNGVLSVYE